MRFNWLLASAAFSISASANPCCGIGPSGIPVYFKGQTNIVIWDAQAKIEHFIRNASFSAESESLGFIAPTPSVPEVKEVNDQAFNVLRFLSPFESDHPEMTRSSGGLGGGGVDVMQQVDAAGYRIITVKATDSDALAKWMKANNFVTNAQIEEWTRFYLKKSWFLNLFKVLKQGQAHKTGTVRLSFKTERPFNPYLAPKANFAERPGGAGLELYLVTKGRYEGAIGDQQYQRPYWVESLNQAQSNQLEEHLKLKSGSLGSGMRVACFKDPAFPRAVPDDLVFYTVDGSGRIKEGGLALNPFSELLGSATR